MHPGAALGGNGVEPVIALKQKKNSFCIIPTGADRVRAGTSRSTCIPAGAGLCREFPQRLRDVVNSEGERLRK